MDASLFLHKCSRIVQEAIRYILDWAATVGKGNRPSDSVILVRVDGIGDFVVWLDSARALRQHYKDRKIILVANEIFADLAERVGYFDQVIGVDLDAFITDWRYRFKMLRDISRIGAETAIQPTYSRLYEFGDSIVRSTCANVRIGFNGDSSRLKHWQRRISDRWYTRLIRASDELLMEVERNREFLNGLGITEALPEVVVMPLVAELPESFQFEYEYFIVFPGAGNWRRMWPAENFSKAAAFVRREFGWRMFVCGSKSEYDLAKQLIEKFELTESLNLAGYTSLTEFVELVRGANLLISNETSAVHIAAAVNTPSVCLLGGGHFKRFLPYPPSFKCTKPVAVYEYMACFGCNWQCTVTHENGKPAPCISKIQVQSVLDAVKRSIKGV